MSKLAEFSPKHILPNRQVEFLFLREDIFSDPNFRRKTSMKEIKNSKAKTSNKSTSNRVSQCRSESLLSKGNKTQQKIQELRVNQEREFNYVYSFKPEINKNSIRIVKNRSQKLNIPKVYPSMKESTSQKNLTGKRSYLSIFSKRKGSVY